MNDKEDTRKGGQLDDQEGEPDYVWPKSPELPEDLKFLYEWLKWELPEGELRQLFEPHINTSTSKRGAHQKSETLLCVEAWKERGKPTKITKALCVDIAKQHFPKDLQHTERSRIKRGHLLGRIGSNIRRSPEWLATKLIPSHD